MQTNRKKLHNIKRSSTFAENIRIEYEKVH